jgi:alanine racemase
MTNPKRKKLAGSLEESGPSAFLSRSGGVESEVSPRAILELNSSALIGNYRAIQELVPDQLILPMVKANAYGHGAGWVARLLVGMPGLYGYGVATLDEGLQLRIELGAKARRIPILVFAETTPWSEEKGQFCEQNGLRAVIASETDWAAFLKGKWLGRISYEIQFNTGMNRLGISPAFASKIARELKSKPADQHPAGVFTHLAMSEDAECRLTIGQLEKFKAIRHELSTPLPGARFHLANSGGIWNAKSYHLRDLTDVVRPGIALYGVPPWPGAPRRNICPVLSFKASVLGIHRLKPGDSIGYGGTFRVSGNQTVFAAILGAGYADGVKRALSNQGYAWLNGKETRFVGMVSMDLCAIQCWAETRVGDWAELWGPQVDPWAQAKSAGTIPYDLLTSLSSRVKRVYDSNSH